MIACRLLIALLAAGLVYGGSLAARRLPLVAPVLPVVVEGTFVPGGEFPGEPLALSPAPRTWGSWAGSDNNEGTLRIGPFPAPARLRLAVSGYPHYPGNDLYLEMADLKIRLSLPTAPVRERWQVKEYDIPFGWRGRLVTIVASDASRIAGGWLAISEPLPPAGGLVLEASLLATFGAWIANGLLLGLCFFAAARWLTTRAWIAAPWIPLVAGAGVALLGYAAFWAYFAHPLAGRCYSAVVFAAAVLAWARTPARAANPKDEWRGVLKLTVGVGLFHLALLHLFSGPRDFYDLAANRFVEALPGDNRLPHDLAMLLYHGKSPKLLSTEWLSSDRPPLQTGWQLLTWPVTAALGFGETTASGTSAVWFQLLWVAAAYGLLRTLGLEPPRARAWIATLALSGFFILNTVFTWPKLSAAALACGAFGLWVLPSPAAPPRVRFLPGAVLAALAWLAHGGVAFSFLALGPWLVWRAARGEWPGWLRAAGVFLLVAAPWIGYQQLYNPPANRLLKWHLGGQETRDPRGTWETIRDGYRALSWPEIIARKTANFEMQISGDWRSLGDFSTLDAAVRRREEFYHSARALTWWAAALPLFGLLAVFPRLRARLAAAGRAQAALAAWVVLTVVIWCLLMFTNAQAVIHQGSYAVMLSAFVLLCAWFDRAGRWWLVAVAGLQTATLVSTYAVPNPVIHGPAAGLPLVVATAAALFGFVLAGHKNAAPRVAD